MSERIQYLITRSRRWRLVTQCSVPPKSFLCGFWQYGQVHALCIEERTSSFLDKGAAVVTTGPTSAVSRPLLELPAAKTKTNEMRVIPVGSRLRAELAMRRHAPDGKPHPGTAYVFGTAVGERVASVKRAWERAVLLSHGHKPVCMKGKPGHLTAECRAALRSINLHMHDLRREFACRLLESSADLHDVRDFLGHANVTTTSRYLKSSPVCLEKALDRLENGIRTPFAHEAESDAFASSSEPSKLLN